MKRVLLLIGIAFVLLGVGPSAWWVGGGGGGSGTGDVVGPSSAVDKTLALFDGTDGKLLQGGGPTYEPATNLFSLPSSVDDGGKVTFTEKTANGNGSVTYGIASSGAGSDIPDAALDCTGDANGKMPTTCTVADLVSSGSWVSGDMPMTSSTTGDDLIASGVTLTSIGGSQTMFLPAGAAGMGSSIRFRERSDGSNSHFMQFRGSGDTELTGNTTVHLKTFSQAVPVATGARGSVIAAVSVASTLDTPELLCDATFFSSIGVTTACVDRTAKKVWDNEERVTTGRDGTANTLTISTNHYYDEDQGPFQITAGAPPTGLAGSTDYYIIYSSATVFQVSLTPAGAAVDFDNDGDATLTFTPTTTAEQIHRIACSDVVSANVEFQTACNVE